MAGSGPHPGAARLLAALRAPVIPAIVGHRRPPTSGPLFAADAVSVLYVPGGRAPAELASALVGGSSAVDVVPDPRRCPGSRRPRATCGLEPNELALVFDTTGRTDIVRVLDVDATTIHLRAVAGTAPLPFEAGSFLMPLVVRSYYLDRTSDRLRLYDGWASDAPVVDNVVGFTVRYFSRADLHPTDLPAPAASCLGATPHRPSPPASAPRPDEELDPLRLSDGPWCGGRLIFDADLFRVTRVRIELRLQVADPSLRGRDRRWFVRPGDGRPGRVIPDVVSVLEVSPRSGLAC
jgi:hypothetical protein